MTQIDGRTAEAMAAADTRSRDPASSDRAEAFARLVEPLRRELRLHCYRMLGSLHEADDLVQETYLRAWRSFDGFDGRGSFRGWLYRIATNACLDALAQRKSAQRLLPDQRASSVTAMTDGVPTANIAWLEPYPDRDFEGVADQAPDPEARYAFRETVQLAFVALIQQLPPRQRAVFLLSDVLGWSAAETAGLLGGSISAINSVLQRARQTLGQRTQARRSAVTLPSAPAEQRLVRRYMQAWEAMDLDGFIALLSEEATYAMPPLPQWYQGRDAIRAFYAGVWPSYAGFRLHPTRANGQPAFAAYNRASADGVWHAHSLHVLTIEGDAIAALTLFIKPDSLRLFEAFGCPPIWAEPPVA